MLEERSTSHLCRTLPMFLSLEVQKQIRSFTENGTQQTQKDELGQTAQGFGSQTPWSLQTHEVTSSWPFTNYFKITN